MTMKNKVATKAFEFAHKAHYPTRRKSGEPYILHPILCCTNLLYGIKLGNNVNGCCTLHDVVEDTEVTVEEIK